MSNRKSTLPAALHELLRRQAGIICTEQLASLIPRSAVTRLVREGWLTPVARGLYSTQPEPGWESWAWAGVLAGGPAAVVGGASALHLEGLLSPAPKPLVVCSPRPVRRVVGPVRFNRAQRRGRGSPPRALMEDALVDAWEEMPEGDLLVVLGRALQLRRTTPARLSERLAERPRCTGHRELLALVGEGGAGVHSLLERYYRSDVERAHGLPNGVRQALTRGGRSDVLYREYGVVVELDGRLGHELQRFRDMERDNRNTVRGLLTLRFGWSAVRESPCAVAQQVSAALAVRGWAGPLSACPRCAHAA